MPPIKIQAHVAAFSLALMPSIFYAIHYYRNKQSDEEMEVMLRKNYSEHINRSRVQTQQFVNVLKNVKDGNSSSETDQDLSRLLRAGKDEIKKRKNFEEILLPDGESSITNEKKDAIINQYVEDDLKKKDGKKKKRKKKVRKHKDKVKDDVDKNVNLALNNGKEGVDGSSVALFLITMGSFAMFSGRRS